MDISALIVWLLIGAVAGWLAGQVMKGKGFGLVTNIILGIVGAFVGGWLCDTLNFSLGSGIIGSILTAGLGAVVVLFVAGLVKK